MHYGVGVVPARPYKPRDKAKVESGELLAERRIIAALRHRKSFSITELNQALRELRDRINQRPFRKREGSRASQFAALDKPLHMVLIIKTEYSGQLRWQDQQLLTRWFPSRTP